jgi:hypothetical protein
MRILAVLAALLSVALLSSCATEMPVPEEETAAVENDALAGDERLNSISLIETAVSTGRIDYSTGMLYKVYTMFDPMSLPPEYKSDVPGKCGTPLIIEIQRNWSRLTPEHRAEISQYVEPLTEMDDGETQLDDVTPDRLDHERERVD